MYTFAPDRQPQENLSPKEYLSKKRDMNYITFCEVKFAPVPAEPSQYSALL